jgi:hypothetical protein
VRYLGYKQRALSLIPKLAAEFATRFGRDSGGLIREYRTEDAETIVVALAAVVATGCRRRIARIRRADWRGIDLSVPALPVAAARGVAGGEARRRAGEMPRRRLGRHRPDGVRKSLSSPLKAIRSLRD